ncbi:MAG: saccharopine dehydrogenase C-terminal domain-containing protein [Desulfobacterales bacterium]|jgi:saccharopine dehydrogenase-like NADP-dependent oxidoreductase
MKAMVAGLGMQGKAVTHDLSKSELIDQVIALDVDLSSARVFLENDDYTNVAAIEADAMDQAVLLDLITQHQIDLLICMMPAWLCGPIAGTCIEAGIPYICTTYASVLEGLDGLARQKNVLLLPEMGFDPGIDLMLAAKAVAQLDEVHGLNSYGSGVPEPNACDNPINYKISWTFEGVLAAYARPARLLKQGKEVKIPAADIFNDEWVEIMDIPDVGLMESYPNGDAVKFIPAMDLGPELKEMGRFTTRWPGHCMFWRTMSHLGFLRETPIDMGDGASVSPRSFLSRLLTPQLQYRDDERDLAFLRVHTWGLKDKQPKSIIYDLIDYRDLKTGFYAMNRTVGYTASIAAQMVLSGQIRGTGILSPMKDVDVDLVLKELGKRGVRIIQRDS